MVLKLDDLSLQGRLGHVGADPEWAIALKFPAQVGRGVGSGRALKEGSECTPPVPR